MGKPLTAKVTWVGKVDWELKSCHRLRSICTQTS